MDFELIILLTFVEIAMDENAKLKHGPILLVIMRPQSSSQKDL